MPLRQLFLATFVPLFVSFAFQSHAQDHGNKKPEKGPAYTEPPKKDVSYRLMGEFVGPVTLAESGEGKNAEQQILGIQVRPTGKEDFEAVSYFGGLPGEEGHKPGLTKMIGRRAGDFLVLSGGPWAIFVDEQECRLVGRDGTLAGTLERVERSSPTLGAKPPEEALVVFDGTNIDHFTSGQMTKDGLLMQGSDFKPMFQDFNLHVEFRLPYMPLADGQQRGNSGLYLQSRYECQVLDSFGTEPVFNGLGALYRMKTPDLNMAFPPLVWQTYDVQFTAPRWASDGSKLRDAHISSWINGVKVQDDVALPSKTGAGKTEEPLLLPIRIQDHGDPVRFRNIWIVDRGLAPMQAFPVIATEEDKASLAAEATNASESEEEPKSEEASAKELAAEVKVEVETDAALPAPKK
ncbi:3-keto-disaccharide hydrolase [Planctomycetes bacterium K23_9]|uniref:3-keto-alpha-glucoside-1,2-lyase/3-keto-2-hydroxy-glucal hydratase domain-containing protein n=1 Tax=Stieleria marina TaxID=1930275 RepID=A0A517P1Q2_9BACT|nr:hypothetical protein K239x_53270 [Planctomycetes bacterium K23_9]